MNQSPVTASQNDDFVQQVMVGWAIERIVELLVARVLKDSLSGATVLARPTNDVMPAQTMTGTPIRVPLLVATVVALVAFGISITPQFQDQFLPSRFAAQPSVDTVSEASLDSTVSQRQQTAQRVARARFFDTTVIPLIAQVDAENRAAADRCLERIELVLKRYHRGVDRFVEDMTSISTRLGVLKRMPGGWWSSDGRVEAYVQQKFEKHLFSEQTLIDDISGALLQFRSDVDANQRMMLTRVQAALTTADLPGVQLDHQEEFFRELSTRVGGYAANQGTTSVENMLGALVLGEVGAFAARSIVGGLLVRFAPSVAISTAAGASATVGASATGAGGGSLGGPVGTVVGFGAGLAIGLVIDWWMTEKFESEMSRQLHVYLNDLGSTLINGKNSIGERASVKSNVDPNAGSSRVAPDGLRDALPRVCDQLHEAYRDRFFQQIVDGEPS